MRLLLNRSHAACLQAAEENAVLIKKPSVADMGEYPPEMSIDRIDNDGTTSLAIVDGLMPKHRPETSAVAGDTESKPLETLLKKPEVSRDEHGRFDRHGKMLAKTAKKARINKQQDNAVIAESVTLAIGAGKPGPGRPRGSKNKVSAALREQILASLDQVGGVNYLARLAIENSSAYASLLGKVLPSTLAVEEGSKGSATIRFERVIVQAPERGEVEGVTPKLIEHRADDRLDTGRDELRGDDGQAGAASQD
jgi:hypothetical protein